MVYLGRNSVLGGRLTYCREPSPPNRIILDLSVHKTFRHLEAGQSAYFFANVTRFAICFLERTGFFLGLRADKPASSSLLRTVIALTGSSVSLFICTAVFEGTMLRCDRLVVWLSFLLLSSPVFVCSWWLWIFSELSKIECVGFPDKICRHCAFGELVSFPRRCSVFRGPLLWLKKQINKPNAYYNTQPTSISILVTLAWKQFFFFNKWQSERYYFIVLYGTRTWGSRNTVNFSFDRWSCSSIALSYLQCVSLLWRHWFRWVTSDTKARVI